LINKHKILVCESQQDLQHILTSNNSLLKIKLLTTSNPDAIPILTREQHPDIIMLNYHNPGNICHRLKMDTSLYSIPLFVVVESNDEDPGLQFLSNELFIKPFDVILLIEKIQHYLQLTETPQETLKSQTRERWIEKKIKHSYYFEFIGTIEMDKMEALKNRIEELLTVGRKDFIINLVHSTHINNLSSFIFHKMHESVQRGEGHLKLILPICTLSEELIHEGVDVDEYVQKNEFHQ